MAEQILCHFHEVSLNAAIIRRVEHLAGVKAANTWQSCLRDFAEWLSVGGVHASKLHKAMVAGVFRLRPHPL
ncbi:hypothetical protein [Rhodopirellula halodulae]|uniref:hypothetical protein n=1 Tax=Rhodopirellula halodulae TaxID=2894198 RepID=UPI001E39E045|nr:hypothetical protein [Rhodopirellula sp. JC737]